MCGFVRVRKRVICDHVQLLTLAKVWQLLSFLFYRFPFCFRNLSQSARRGEDRKWGGTVICLEGHGPRMPPLASALVPYMHSRSDWTVNKQRYCTSGCLYIVLSTDCRSAGSNVLLHTACACALGAFVAYWPRSHKKWEVRELSAHTLHWRFLRHAKSWSRGLQARRGPMGLDKLSPFGPGSGVCKFVYRSDSGWARAHLASLLLLCPYKRRAHMATVWNSLLTL